MRVRDNQLITRRRMSPSSIPVSVPTAPNPLVDDWVLGLCDTGPWASPDCWYACCCPHFALASARTDLDGSDCCFNCCCVTPLNARWLVRTALGIPGTAERDCCLTCCCVWCVANQTLQTTRALREYQLLPRVERTRPWLTTTADAHRRWWTVGHGCYAFWCLPCAVALALEDGVGMPCWMGYWCTTPCGGRNIVKSHYRIGVTERNECHEDCCLPSTAYACTHALPPVSWLLSALFFAKFVAVLRWEVDLRTPPATAKKQARTYRQVERRYLAGYRPVDGGNCDAMDRALFNVAATTTTPSSHFPTPGTGKDLDVTVQQPI